MGMSRVALLRLAQVGLCALVLSACSLQPNIALSRAKSTVGSKAPALSGVTLRGEAVSVTFQGHRTVLNFWASWCGPCRHEQPGLNRIAADFAAQGVQVYGVDMLDHDRSQAAAFLQEFKVPYPSIYDDAGKLAAAYEVDAPPSFVLVDDRGTIVGRIPGEASEETVRRLIQSKLLR